MTQPDFNKWADYWFETIGVNVIPTVSKYKTGKKGYTWKDWQFKPIPDDVFAKWKTENAFSEGIGVMAGKVWRGPNKGRAGEDVYLIFIDCDNSLAIKEFCTRNGQTKSLKDIAEKFIVEQHLDNPNKAHIYFYSDIPFPKRSSDILEKEAAENKELAGVPLYEVKGKGAHGIAYATPSMHQNGHRYEIIGNPDPVVFSEQGALDLQKHIDNICKKYGLTYLEYDDGKGSAKVPMASLYDDDIPIMKGQNRHEGIMRLAESLIRKNRLMKLPPHILKKVIWAVNDTKCEPPLDDKEMEKQWKAANEFMVDKLNDADELEEELTTEEEADEELKLQQEYARLTEEFKKPNHNLPIIPPEELGLDHAGRPVCTKGTVYGVSGLVPDWSMIRWECKACHNKNRADAHDETRPPKKCRQCDSDDGYIEDLDLTIEPKINQQAILLQHKSESLSCFLSGTQEQMWQVRAGQKVQALGIQKYKSIYNRKLNQKEWLKYFKLLAIKPMTGTDVKYTETDVEYFKELVQLPNFIEEILVPSFAPAVKGNMDDCKLVCIYTLGSQGLERPFNSVLLGPPAKGKTECTTFTSEVSHNGNLTEFIQTSVAGLITETRRDPISGAMIAVPGILGTFSIACFTDMNAAVHHPEGKKLFLSLNHALESKIATSGKAGGSQSFDARCAVLCDSNNYAASWYYDEPLRENLKFLPASTISRYDLGAVVPKETTKQQSRDIAKSNYRSYRQKQNPIKLHEDDWTDPDTGAPRMGLNTLRKYFFFVSQQPLPELPEDTQLEDYFADNYVNILERDYQLLVDGRYNRTSLLLSRVRARLLLKHLFNNTADKKDLDTAITFVNKWKNIEVIDPKTGEKDANYTQGAATKKEIEEFESEAVAEIKNFRDGCQQASEESIDGYFTKMQLADILAKQKGAKKWLNRDEVATMVDKAMRQGILLENEKGQYSYIKPKEE